MKRNFLIDFVDALEGVVGELKDFEVMNYNTGKRTFFRGLDAEFKNSLRGVAQFPCVVMEASGWFDNVVSYKSQDGMVSKTRQTNFIVVDTYEDRADVEQIDSAVTTCERLGEELLKGLIAKGGEAVDNIDFDGVVMRTEVNEEQKYVFVQFVLGVESVVDVCLDANMWRD